MKKKAERTNSKPRILFVDDEASIRFTLSAILTGEGFEVTTAATVAEALGLIATKEFDVLIADLNIGESGDGFTVVSAMRRSQPTAATFILTGYPDFQTALEAIRQQVDEYLIKPAGIREVVEKIKARLKRPHYVREVPSKRLTRVATVVRESKTKIVQLWLAEAQAERSLRRVELTDKQRMDHIPSILETLTQTLEPSRSELTAEALQAAGKHGLQRKEHGYTAPMVAREAGILHNILTRVIEEHLLEIDLSTVIWRRHENRRELECLTRTVFAGIPRHSHPRSGLIHHRLSARDSSSG